MTTPTSAIDWNAAKDAIRAFIAACSVVEPGELIDPGDGTPVSDPYANIIWQQEANAISYADLIELRIGGETTVGDDDVEDVEQLDGSFRSRVTAHAEFVLSIRFNTRNQVTAARGALSKVRASFHHPERSQILDDAGLGYLGTEMLITEDAISDERWESIGVLDVRMSITSELYEPETDEPIGYLQSVGISVNGSTPEVTVTAETESP